MSRTRSNHISAEAQRELEAIDAALAGAPVFAEYASLADFARELRATRPTADERFLARLDARAAQGFESPSARTSASGRWPLGRERLRALGNTVALRGLTARPALGLALAALLTVAVVVPLALSGGGHGHEAGPSNARTEIRSGASEPAKAPEPAEPKNGTKRGSAAGAAAAGAVAGPLAPSASAAPARQVERTASLEVGVAPDAIESRAHQVFTIVSSFNGYVRQSNVSSGGPGQGGASFDIRVPSANLANAIATLAGLGHVRSENNATNDVTDQFNSLQSSLAKLRAERSSLLKQLARASEGQEEARLKDRLRYVDAQISQQQGALGALSNRINYTALALSLTPEVAAASKHSELTPGAAARNAAKVLEAALAVLVLAAAALLPLGLIALSAWVVTATTRKRLREQALDAS
jgi:hypothetical protein